MIRFYCVTIALIYSALLLADNDNTKNNISFDNWEKLLHEKILEEPSFQENLKLSFEITKQIDRDYLVIAIQVKFPESIETPDQNFYRLSFRFTQGGRLLSEKDYMQKREGLEKMLKFEMWQKVTEETKCGIKGNGKNCLSNKS